MMTIEGNSDTIRQFARWFDKNIGTEFEVDFDGADAAITCFEVTQSEYDRCMAKFAEIS
jgi:hypothetical protein